MTIAWPSSPNPSVVVPNWLFPTRISEAQDLSVQAASRGVNRWAWKASYVNMPRSVFAPYGAVIAQMRGRYNVCTAVHPGLETPLGSGWGSPQSNGVNAIGSYTVTVKGLTAGQSPAVKAMDFIKFSGHSKVYMVVADANSDGSGHASLSIMPALYAATADGEVMTVNSVPFTVAATIDKPSWTAVPPFTVSFDVDFLERWP